MTKQLKKAILRDVFSRRGMPRHAQGESVHGILVVVERLSNIQFHHLTMYIASRGSLGYGHYDIFTGRAQKQIPLPLGRARDDRLGAGEDRGMRVSLYNAVTL